LRRFLVQQIRVHPRKSAVASLFRPQRLPEQPQIPRLVASLLARDDK
jgi:hypothetical protein